LLAVRVVARCSDLLSLAQENAEDGAGHPERGIRLVAIEKVVESFVRVDRKFGDGVEGGKDL
jgi:hypothetical protein